MPAVILKCRCGNTKNLGFPGNKDFPKAIPTVFKCDDCSAKINTMIHRDVKKYGKDGKVSIREGINISKI